MYVEEHRQLEDNHHSPPLNYVLRLYLHLREIQVSVWEQNLFVNLLGCEHKLFFNFVDCLSYNSERYQSSTKITDSSKSLFSHYFKNIKSLKVTINTNLY